MSTGIAEKAPAVHRWSAVSHLRPRRLFEKIIIIHPLHCQGRQIRLGHQCNIRTIGSTDRANDHLRLAKHQKRTDRIDVQNHLRWKNIIGLHKNRRCLQNFIDAGPPVYPGPWLKRKAKYSSNPVRLF